MWIGIRERICISGTRGIFSAIWYILSYRYHGTMVRERNLKPITCHMDFPSEQTELIHPLVEAHLVDARAQGE